MITLSHPTLELPRHTSTKRSSPHYLHLSNLLASQVLHFTILNPQKWCLNCQVLSNLHLIQLDHLQMIRNVLPKLRHMKHTMKILKRWCQCKSIGHFSYFFQNLVMTNKTQCEISIFQSTTNTYHWTDSQEHMISLLEFKCFCSLIMITLLYALWSFHLLLIILIFLIVYRMISGPSTVLSLKSYQHKGILHLVPHRASNYVIPLLESKWLVYVNAINDK